MNNEQKIECLRERLNLLSVLSEDSEADRLRDELWKSKLESELVELQKKLIGEQLNCLAHLAKAKTQYGR